LLTFCPDGRYTLLAVDDSCITQPAGIRLAA
jgi:hypothetical protein